MKTNIKRMIKTTAVVICVLALAVGGASTAFASGTVTDNISVKIGYWGMDQNDYVTKKSYHWTQLDDCYGGALKTHKIAYSFFRQSDSVMGKNFSTVVDSARGFYIEDLIEYAGISLRDVQGISFYTNDVTVGYFTSFTYGELFGTQRYYFDDLSSYLTPVWKDEDHEYMEDVLMDDRVWNAKKVVKPILALEDRWDQYEAGTEHTSANFSSMGTGNRFRLLFGQTNPTEMRTNQTAKYVHTIYVTLNGKPKIKSDNIKLSDKIGSHTVTFKVAAGDEGMIEDMLNKLKWSSSDEKVLNIKNVRMETLDQYDDAIEVTLSYEILKEGEAYINGSYLGMTVEGKTLKVGGKGSGKGNGNGNGTGKSSKENVKSDKGSEGTEKAEDTEEPEGGNEADGLQAYVLSDDVAQMLAEVDEAEYEQLEVEEDTSAKDALPFAGGGAALALAAGAAGGVIDFRRRK